MAKIYRTADFAIWFNDHNYKGEFDILQKLRGLRGNETVVLTVDGVGGTWARFNGGALALRPFDQAARRSWEMTKLRKGQWIEISVAGSEVLQVERNYLPKLPSELWKSPEGSEESPASPSPVKERAFAPCRSRFVPTKRYEQGSAPTLCIGLDLAWWGGSQREPDSQYDALAYMVVGGGEKSLQTERVCLGATFNAHADATTANCDADARLLVASIQNIIEDSIAANVVLAIDAPLLAKARNLPPRSKNPPTGSLQRRLPEDALENAKRSSPQAWASECRIQPGAPICGRVAALVDALTRELGFELYDHDSVSTPSRTLFESFPSEAIWALGCQGQYDPITPSEARHYKNDKRSRSAHIVARDARDNLYGFVSSIGLPNTVVGAWIEQTIVKLVSDPMLRNYDGNLKRGKLFDDIIDAVNCLFTAVAFCQNSAHVWEGSDPQDGHIIGPGK